MVEKKGMGLGDVKREDLQRRLELLRRYKPYQKAEEVKKTLGEPSVMPKRDPRFLKRAIYGSLSLMVAAGLGIGYLGSRDSQEEDSGATSIRAFVDCVNRVGSPTKGISFQLKRIGEGSLPERVTVFIVTNDTYSWPIVVYPRNEGFYVRVNDNFQREIRRDGPHRDGQISFMGNRFRGEFRVYEGEISIDEAKNEKPITEIAANSEECM